MSPTLHQWHLHEGIVVIHVGVTGTQRGCTLEQMGALATLLGQLQDGESWLHHGDCIGVDAEAHAIARRTGWKIRGHPPTNPGKRAWCDCDGMDAERPYLDRNRVIVRAASTGLIAVPSTAHPILRSGTWSTVRYATKLEKTIWVIRPDGKVFLYEHGEVVT